MTESKHGESKQDFSEDEDADTRNENEQAEIDTAMHEPPPKSKAAGNEIALGNEEEKDADDKSTEDTDDAAQSGEGTLSHIALNSDRSFDETKMMGNQTNR